MQKILFIQLPLIDHGYNYIDGNIPYASATLKAFLEKNYSSRVECNILPIEISNFASDKNIVKYILDYKPDIVAFSSFLWNVERHLHISKLLKNHNTKVLFGGPEIQEDSFIFEEFQDSVNIFFSGEGEWFFRNYLDNKSFEKYSKTINNNLFITQPAEELIAAEDIIEPFTNNALTPLPDGSIFLELTRGCPYKCSYCFYSKNSSKIRELSFQHLLDSISIGKKTDLKEIYILSPTFNKTKEFKNNLKKLIDIDHNIKLHTEMRADSIDKETAEMIVKAGFKTLEVGLQTLNKYALKAIGRHGDILKELNGIKILKDAGIEIKIGIIPGLPGDNPESFKDTIDTLAKEGFEEEIEFYPLMILPGTKMRNSAEKENFIFQKKPPYYLIENKTFDYNSLIFLKEYIEDVTGFYSSINKLPNFIQNCNSTIYNSCSFNGDIEKNWNIDNYESIIDSSVFSYIINLNKGIDLKKCLLQLFRDRESGSELFNVIFQSNLFINENDIHEFLDIFEIDSFFQRSHLYDEWKNGNRVMFYQITTNVTDFAKFYKEYQVIEPILELNEENILTFLKLQTEEPIYILVSESIYSQYNLDIIKLYKEYIDKISFKDKTVLKMFMKDIECESIEYNIEFNSKAF